MEETPFFFEADGHRLFGVLHAPAGTARDTAFVFCHPFGEEKLWVHRVYVAFASELAARGFGVLRFDMVGHGDSGGRFEDASIDAYLADIRHAAARPLASRAAQEYRERDYLLRSWRLLVDYLGLRTSGASRPGESSRGMLLCRPVSRPDVANGVPIVTSLSASAGMAGLLSD